MPNGRRGSVIGLDLPRLSKQDGRGDRRISGMILVCISDRACNYIAEACVARVHQVIAEKSRWVDRACSTTCAGRSSR